MLSFASSLSSDNEAFAIFVNDKFQFNDKKNLLPKEARNKIDSYLETQKDKKNEEEINSLDISSKQKCFIIKVKKKYNAHDENNKFKNGDKVSIIESKPFSKNKKFQVFEEKK